MSVRSWLFVPGDSAPKMEKGLASDADALILDLEDSVAAARKPQARRQVAAILGASRSAPRHPLLWVRINPLATTEAKADLEALVDVRPDGLVLPKPDSAEDVRRLDAMCVAAGIETVPILPIATETPLSVFRLDSYAPLGARLGGLTWGAEDLSAAVGASSARTERDELTGLYQLARSLCLAAAAAARVPAIETVYPDFRDIEGLVAYATRGRRDGFTGMMAIHPAQVAPINAVFTPTAEETDYAERVTRLFADNPDLGVVGMDGKMLDRPHLIQAQRILAMAARSKPRA